MEALGKIGEKNSTNDHSVRDFTVMSSGYATVKSDNTGYRFVKIEALECDVFIRCVRGIFVHRDIERVGSFECSDAEVNKIWDVGAYTVFLNMQEYLLDGIKRDRLVWAGDMHPEVKTVLSVYGNCRVIPKSLDFVVSGMDDEWLYNIPTYSSWW